MLNLEDSVVTGKNDDEVFDNFIKAIAELKEKLESREQLKNMVLRKKTSLLHWMKW